MFKSLEEDQPDQAREWLKTLPLRMQRRAEYLYARAVIPEHEDHPIAALDDLDDIIHRYPGY